MMAAKSERHWRFKRSAGKDRVYLDWFGKRQEPKLTDGMAHVKELLRQVVDQSPVDTGIALDDLRKIWKEVSGEMIAHHSEPLSIEQRVLVVRVTQPVIRFELVQMKALLIQNIRETLPELRIRDLKIVL